MCLPFLWYKKKPPDFLYDKTLRGDAHSHVRKMSLRDCARSTLRFGLPQAPSPGRTAPS